MISQPNRQGSDPEESEHLTEKSTYILFLCRHTMNDIYNMKIVFNSIYYDKAPILPIRPWAWILVYKNYKQFM